MYKNENDNWVKKSFCTLLIGSAFLFFCSPVMFIKSPDIRMAVALFMLPVFFLSAVLIPCFLACKKNICEMLDLKLPGIKDFGIALTMIPLFFLFAGLTALLKKFGYEPPPQFLVSYAKDCPQWLFYLILFCAGILAPVSEELAFRRVMALFFREIFPGKFGTVAVYFIPSFLFAIFHGFVWQSVLLFFLALILQRNQLHGSITRTILMHAVFNWCSLSVLILVRTGLLPGAF